MKGRRAAATLAITALAGALAAMAFSDDAPVAVYAVTDLGPLPHVADDVAMGINRAGAVAFWVPNGDEAVQAVVWSGGVRRGLPLPAGERNSMARAINDRGQVAGWVSTSANSVDSGATVRGVVYTDGKARLLGTLGGRGSRANGIGADGRPVGVADRPDGRKHGFVETDGRMTDLGTLPGGNFSEAFAVNAAGDAAGVADDAKGVKRAVVWRGGRTHDLGILPGGGFSSAQAINDRGQVAGFSDTGSGIHAFLVTAGRMQDLGTLGDEPSTALSVNGRGDVVGASNVNERVRHAFLWRRGRMADLNLSLPVSSGWSLTEADAINDRGEIVCVGSRKGGRPQAVLLTPVGGKAVPVARDRIGYHRKG